jgi:hypothetical protein
MTCMWMAFAWLHTMTVWAAFVYCVSRNNAERPLLCNKSPAVMCQSARVRDVKTTREKNVPAMERSDPAMPIYDM